MQHNKQKIIILGAGITGLSLAYLLKQAGKECIVFDTRQRVGGVIHTQYKEDFIYEEGPNSGVLGNSEVIQLFQLLGNSVSLEKACDIAKDRWILKSGKWHSLPSSIWSGITTPLFSWQDKLRLMGEPFRTKGNNPNETLSAMVKRRMGKSFLDYAVDPFILGIYAGNPNVLIPKYALPKLYQLEQNYGSFIKGAYHKARLPKTDLEKAADRSIFSFKGGLSSLTHALEKGIGTENIILNVKSTSLAYKKSTASFVFSYEKSGLTELVHSPQVISTFGGKALKQLLCFEEQEAIEHICKMPYANVISATIGFKKWKGITTNAFGGLIPFKEQENVLGILFMSSIFKNRAPKNGAMFNLFIGGMRKAELVYQNQDRVLHILEHFFRRHMGLKHFNPDILSLKRIAEAIPQYTIESAKRLESINYLEKKYAGLHLAGNIRDGIGIADRIQQASLLANQIIST